MCKFRVVSTGDKYTLEIYDPYLWIIPNWSRIGKYVPYFVPTLFNTIEGAEAAAMEFCKAKSKTIVKEFSIP